MELYTPVWVAVLVSAAMLGTLVTLTAFPAALLAVDLVLLVALGALLAMHTDVRGPSTDRAAWDRCLRAGLLAPVVVGAATGIVLVLGPAGLVLVLLLGLGAPALLERTVVRGDRQRGLTSVPPLGTEVPAWSTEQLCLFWRGSLTALQTVRGDAARARLVSARQQCLTELERREPAAVRQWLRSGPRADSDLAPYVRAWCAR